MRILFGTHQMELRAGSELFTKELAYSVRARGHEVAIFTFFKGDLSTRIEAGGIPVFGPDETNSIASFAPDIVQTNHIPCAHFLRSAVRDAVRVHAMLGVIPPLEAPPLDAGAFSLGLAVSEEVVDRINQTSFGRDVDVALFRNWFDDGAVTRTEPSKPRNTLRVAVVSNHIASELVAALRGLQTAGRLDVDYFGIERKSVDIDGALLGRYDLIIAIGRTVLLAAACGVPCIMADVFGSDGLLTADNLDFVRRVNFSGRLKSEPITAAHLQEEIDKLPSYDREKLRRKVASEYSLNSRTEWLLSRYEALLTGRRAAIKTSVQKDPALLAPSEGLVHAEITAEVRNLRKQLEKARRKIARLRRSRRNLSNAFASLRAFSRYVRQFVTRRGPEFPEDRS